MNEARLVLGIVLSVGVASILFIFTSSEPSGMLSTKLFIERCSLEDGFEKSFLTKKACDVVVHDRCAKKCPARVEECVRLARRDCGTIGRLKVGV